jgi:hypothetical protein
LTGIAGYAILSERSGREIPLKFVSRFFRSAVTPSSTFTLGRYRPKKMVDSGESD